MKKAFLVILALWTLPLLAETSVMNVQTPVPPPAKNPVESPPAAASVKNRSYVDCRSYLANPEAGAMLWSEQKVFFVGRRSAKNPGSGNAILYRTDLVTGKHRRILAFKASNDMALVAHGHPRLQAISLVNFADTTQTCREGTASAIGVQWDGEQKTYPTFPSATYKLIATEDGPELTDMGKNFMEMLDALTLQRRKLVSFEADVIPLYVQKAPVMLIAFNNQTRELQKFELLKKKPSSVVRLKSDMRLLQQGERFGMLTAKSEGRTLQVAQVKGWSGNETRVFDLILPNGWDDKNSETLIDFESGQAVVLPIPALRRDMRNILIFDGPGKKLLKSLQAPAGSYFPSASLSPDGKHLAVLVAALEDGGAQALWIEEKGSTRKMELTRANEEPKEEKAPAPALPAVPKNEQGRPALPGIPSTPQLKK